MADWGNLIRHFLSTAVRCALSALSNPGGTMSDDPQRSQCRGSIERLQSRDHAPSIGAAYTLLSQLAKGAFGPS